MTLYQYISEEILKKSWEQLLRSMFSNKKLRQLLSLKPIEIYKSAIQLDFEGSKVDVQIESHVENIIEKRLSNPFLFFDFSQWMSRTPLSYNFHVHALAKMDFANVANYLTKHFVNIEYALEEGKYKFSIQKIELSHVRNKLQVHLHIQGQAKWWRVTKKAKGILKMEGNLAYNPVKKLVHAIDVDYAIDANDAVIKLIDNKYHHDFKQQLTRFLRLNVREELFNAKIAAQEEINKIQSNPEFFVNGALLDLEIERIYADKEGIKATLKASGKLHLNR
ncbi:MAG: DUF4403 family protein [Chitinophagales bacterium]|nr:DUF4403 family protein [Chitinophagales bacterium]